MKGFLAGVTLLAVMLGAPAVAAATTINVDTVDDEYGSGASCSLREAITAARNNAAFGGCGAGSVNDTILLPAGSYQITRAGDGENGNATGDLDIGGSGDLEIRPVGQNARVAIDGNGIDRVFDKSGADTFTLKSVRVHGGKLTGAGDGGGILAAAGQTVIEDVTVDSNVAPNEGGGITVYSILTGVNSTISRNAAGGNGGGFYASGGSTVTLRSSTIARNRADADQDGNGFGGGFADAMASSINFTNVVNAGNSAATPGPPGQANDCSSGPFYFPRHTLQTQPIGPVRCLSGFNPGTNVVTANAKLGPLAYNGGQTPTHDLRPGSPAIGAGGTAPPDQCPGTDQNGVARPATSCDIGSVQFVPAPKLRIGRIFPRRKVIRRGRSRVFTIFIRNTGTGPIAASRVCLRLPRASRRGLRVRGRACRAAGPVAIGRARRVRFRLIAKRRARRRAYPVVVRAKGNGLRPVRRQIRVRVR